MEDPDWIESDFSTDFVPALVTDRRHDGHIYFIPEEINVAGLWHADIEMNPLITRWNRFVAWCNPGLSNGADVDLPSREHRAQPHAVGAGRQRLGLFGAAFWSVGTQGFRPASVC